MRGQKLQPIAARAFIGRDWQVHPVLVWTDEPAVGPDGGTYALLRVGTGEAELTIEEMRTLIFQLTANIEMAHAMLAAKEASDGTV
jgi:hypothetical protein